MGTTPAERKDRHAALPDGAPEFVDAMPAHGGRPDLRWAVAVLLGDRDVRRHLAAERDPGAMAA